MQRIGILYTVHALRLLELRVNGILWGFTDFFISELYRPKE